MIPDLIAPALEMIQGRIKPAGVEIVQSTRRPAGSPASPRRSARSS